MADDMQKLPFMQESQIIPGIINVVLIPAVVFRFVQGKFRQFHQVIICLVLYAAKLKYPCGNRKKHFVAVFLNKNVYPPSDFIVYFMGFFRTPAGKIHHRKFVRHNPVQFFIRMNHGADAFRSLPQNHVPVFHPFIFINFLKIINSKPQYKTFQPTAQPAHLQFQLQAGFPQKPADIIRLLFPPYLVDASGNKLRFPILVIQYVSPGINPYRLTVPANPTVLDIAGILFLVQNLP